MKLLYSARRALALAACTLCVAAAMSQATNSGDIRGVVTDSTGAKIPGVTVTVTNINTGITKILTTNNDGLYDTSSIVVGTYSVSFEKPGFAQFERSSLSLQVGASTVNAVLQVGADTESVVVNTDLPLLDTESGAQQTVLDAKSMQVLPNVGQAWQNFTILLPGTSGGTGSSNGTVNPGQAISANGNLPYSNVLADGASTTLSHSSNSDVNIFETVAELQVSTSAFSAQYGIGGIIFNQISKGGTDKFHGTAYEYFQSSQFNSNTAQINGTGTRPTLPSFHYNNFGGSIGGPVLIPHTGLGRKAFFFFNYDQIISHGAGSTGVNSVPTAGVMGGDFTGQNLIYDPTTQTIGHDANGTPYPIRRSFLSEYGTNAVPQALFDKVAANFQKFYPTQSSHLATGYFIPGNVNGQGILQNNFYATVPSSSPARRFFGRFDYDINSRNRLTMSVTQRDVPAIFPNAVTPCPIGCQNGDVESYNPQISDVFTISPRTINEARIGYTYQGNFYADDTLNKGYAAGLGWQYAKADTIPAIQFITNYPYAWIQPSVNAVYKEHVFDPSDVVTMIRGKHIIHFGGEMLIYQDNSTNWGNTNAGTFQFSGQYTQNWTLDKNGVAHPNSNSGTDYADFLLGDANNWGASVSPEYAGRLKSPQVFVQDDYKITPTLTLNLGIRYQVRIGWSETHGNEATYDPTVVNPANGKLGAYWFGSTQANGRNALEDHKYTTILPRAGFSWLVNPTMTLRGGFGVYAYNLSLDTYGGGLGQPQSASGNYNDPTSGIIPATQLGGTGTVFGTNTALPYTQAGTSPTRYNGQSVGYTQFDTPDPKIYQWNLDIQQAIGTNTSFELAYVASHGFNLNFPTDLNQVPLQQMSLLSAAYAQRPNLNYNAINGSTNNAISNYNSLQASINRRLARGLSFGFNYTWSHFLDDQDSSGWGSREGPQNRQYQDAASNYSNSNFDVRNSFKGNIVYQLPVGRGRMFFNHNALVDEVFGGYQISSTMQFRSGNPFSVFANNANTYAEPSQTPPFPNYTGLPTNPRNGRSSFEWFNPAAFSLPADGTFGNVRRNSLYGPGLELVDISAGKKFDLYESVKLQIRVDSINAFNHTSLGTPNGGLVNTQGIVAGQPFNLDATGTAGQITGAQISGRTLQGGVRLEF